MTFEENKKRLEEEADKILEIRKQKKFNEKEAKRKKQKENKKKEIKENNEWAHKLYLQRKEHYKKNFKLKTGRRKKK